MTDNKSFLSTDTTDKVVWAGSSTGTILSGNTGSGDVEVVTPITEYTLPIGIYSTDGGTTWNDCEGIALLSSSRGTDVRVWLRSRSNGNAVWQANLDSGTAGADITVQVKIALLSIEGAAPYLDVGYYVRGETPAAYVHSSSNETYRKIVQSDQITSFNDGLLRTIAHNQSDFPMAQHWAKALPAYGTTVMPFSGFIRVDGGAITEQIGVYYDSTNMYARAQGGGTYSDYYYRIYQEN